MGQNYVILFVCIGIFLVTLGVETHHGIPEEHEQAPQPPPQPPQPAVVGCCVCTADRFRTRNYCQRHCQPVPQRCLPSEQRFQELRQQPRAVDPCQPPQPQCHVEPQTPPPPPPPTEPVCPPRESFQRCQQPCEMQCGGTYRIVKVCVPVCAIPKCRCEPGYVRNRRGVCVNALKCASNSFRSENLWPTQQQQQQLRLRDYSSLADNDPHIFRLRGQHAVDIGFASVKTQNL